MQLKRRHSEMLVVLFGAIAFMIPALYNGYPIFTADIGTYIGSGFELKIPDDRPVFYGLFIRLSSLGISLWLTIFLQCLILAFVFTRFVSVWIPGLPRAHKGLFLLFASLCTIGGWYASQLMPDIFVAVMFLSVLVLLKRGRAKREGALMLAICLLAAITHNSNYITLTLFSLLLLAASFVFRNAAHVRRKALALVGTSAAAWLILCSSNYVGTGKFTASNAAHVFLMGKLVESGVLKTYLDKACPVYGYAICPYKDSMPAAAWGFVWDEKSPLYKTGGWDANKTEYKRIQSDILSRPKYWPYLAFKSGEATCRQLVQINIDGVFELGWIRYLNGSPPFEAVARYFPHELGELTLAKENNNALDTKFMNSVYCACMVTLLLAACLILGICGRPQVRGLSMLLLSLLFLNAFTTATFANVLTRLNSRVIWLLPVLCAMYVYSYFFRSRKQAAPVDSPR